MGEAARAYAEELSRFKYGHALWWPEPAEDSNGNYQEIDIGDVGRIDEDGAFQRLFNVTSGSPFPPPGDFTPLTYDKSLVTRKKRFFPSGPIHSSSVSSHKIVTELSANHPVTNTGSALSYRFQCKSQRGAVLMVWDDADKTIVHQQERLFTAYMSRHHRSWHAYVTSLDGLGMNCQPEDIILVRGFVKTSRWTVAAFLGDTSYAHEVALDGQLGAVINVGLSYSSEGSSQCAPLPPRSGPLHRIISRNEFPLRSSLTTPGSPSTSYDGDSTPRDQCIFLNYHKIRYRRWLLPDKINAAGGADDLLKRDDNGNLPPALENVDVEMESENVKPRNPLDDILDYILEVNCLKLWLEYSLNDAQCSDANVAIACHDDLQPFTLNDDWTITLPGLLRRLQPEIDIHESVGMLRENGSYRSSSQARNVKSFSEVPEVESTSAWQSASSAVDTRSSAWRSSRNTSSVIGFTSNTTRQQNAGGHNFMAYFGVPHIGQIIPQAGYFAPQPYMPYPNIKFTVNHTLGIRLVDAINPAFDGLDDADFCPQILENMMTKIMLRIKWPGYPAWSDALHLSDHTHNFNPNTLKKVAQLVAQKIQKFSNEMREYPYDEASGVDGWQLHRYPFEKLVLLELQHVGQGSWQPVISAI